MATKGDEGLGISWLWQLPNTHPFHQAAVEHDKAYYDKKEDTSYYADRAFYLKCRRIAGRNKKLKFQAKLFYYFARGWGILFW